MKYYYNEDYESIFIYPDNWWDVIRMWLTWFLHPSFKLTWKDQFQIGKKSSHTIERKLKETNYPHEVSE